jgi:hypothetical protein
MALQPIQVSDGSTVFFDTTTKKIMTEGGKQDSFYKATDANNAVQVWNQRLANKSSNASSPTGNASSGSNLNLNAGQPTIDLNSIYSSAMNSDEIKKLENEYNTKQASYNQAVTSINDNPFASEATRVGKIRRLDESAQRELTSLQNTLAQKKADAQVKVNIATQQYNINNQQYQNELSKLNLLISSGALNNASGSDIASIALSTGMSTSMIKGIQDKMKSDAVKPQVITNTDDSGNVTVSVIDANTGKRISQSSLGKVGKSDSSGSSNPFKPGTPTYISAINAMSKDLQAVSGGDKKVSPNDYTLYRQQWVQAGFNPSDFDNSFKGYINPAHAQDYLVGMPSQAKTDILQQLGIN